MLRGAIVAVHHHDVGRDHIVVENPIPQLPHHFRIVRRHEVAHESPRRCQTLPWFRDKCRPGCL
jgi:hypothetical protein